MPQPAYGAVVVVPLAPVGIWGRLRRSDADRRKLPLVWMLTEA
jgi:hypothetical protein